uniref:cytosolic 5'-nucleotidase 1A n=1 Tax=Lonchura striata TaxID=40157 RepID=UPI001293EF1E|nr:cytosolic 5'-nucleotidase 1A [Lonchura striata domestica]
MEPPGPAGAPGRPWDEAKAFYDNLAPKKKPKSPKPENAITIAVSSRALFRMEEEQKIYTEQGVEAYVKYQLDHENEPFLPGAAFPFVKGPLKGFLEALGKLQKKFYSKGLRLECPIRTYLVTARSAASSGARALKTLRSWGLETDEALFLAGAPKGPLLRKIRPHIFFDDQMFHVEGAQEMGAVAAHVPYGVAQRHKQHKQQTTNSK